MYRLKVTSTENNSSGNGLKEYEPFRPNLVDLLKFNLDRSEDSPFGQLISL